MKKTSLFATLIALVLCMAMVLTGCNGTGMSAKEVSKDPQKQVTESMQKTMDTIGFEIGDVLAKAMEKGEITIELGEDIKNTLYTNAEKKQYANHLFIKDQDSGQEVEMDFFYKDKEVAIMAPAFFGEGAYGVNLNNFKKDLKDSILLDMMETDYDTFMDENEEAFDQLMELLDELGKSENKSLLELKAEIDKVMKKVQISVADGEIEIDGAKVKVVNVTYAMTTDHIRELVEVFFDWYGNQMKEFEEMFASEDTDMSDMIEIETDIDIEEMREELEEALEEIEGTCNIVFSINVENEYVSMIKVDMDGEVDEEKASIDMTFTLGADPSKSNKKSIVVEMTNPDGEKAELSFVYEIIKNEGNKQEIEITLETKGLDEDSKMEINIEYDKNSKEFKLTAEADDSELEIEGEYERTDKMLSIEIESVSVDGEEEKVGLKFVAKVTDGKSMPDMPEYTNLLKMSEEDFVELAEKIEELAGAFEPSYPEYPDDPYYPDVEYPEESKPSNPGDGSQGTSVGKPIEGGAGTCVHSDGNAEVYITGLKSDEDGVYVMLKIVNKTNKEIRCSVDTVSVNKITMLASVMGSVPANTTSEECYIELWCDYLEMANITEIGSIAVPHMAIYDTEDYDTLAEFAFTVNTGLSVSQPVSQYKQTVYDANGVTIYAKGDMYDDYGEYMTTLLVVNSTGKNIVLELEDICVNGKDTDEWEYESVYKDNIRYIQIGFWDDDIEDLGLKMGEIKTITFDLTVEDADSYDEICESKGLTINIGE